jgi:hypothetical protein
MVTNDMNNTATDIFHARLKGTFYGILQWQALDVLWACVKSGQWFFYQVGEALPEQPLSGDVLAVRIGALNTLLRQDHDYHYCGIVYVDHVESPSLIKVYDPNNIGSSCSRSDTPSPARWIISVSPPSPIVNHVPVPNSRRRWWQLFHNG